MGIEDNFATQVEETDRVRGARDEQFYRRQADNYADLEKQTQKLIEVFGALEDKLSGIIGARTSNRISEGPADLHSGDITYGQFAKMMLYAGERDRIERQQPDEEIRSRERWRILHDHDGN
jgi:hypothetical protein